VVIPYYRIAFETLDIFCQITKPFFKVNLNSFFRFFFSVSPFLSATLQKSIGAVVDGRQYTTADVTLTDIQSNRFYRLDSVE